jgi:hypothetical protein
MSENEIKNQINLKQNEISKIEEEFKEKSSSIKNEVEGEYNPKINESNSKLKGEQETFDEAMAKAAEWNAKKKELKISLKGLKKESSILIKEKEKTLDLKLKETNNEKKTKIKTINTEIKTLQKKLTELEKASTA